MLAVKFSLLKLLPRLVRSTLAYKPTLPGPSEVSFYRGLRSGSLPLGSRLESVERTSLHRLPSLHSIAQTMSTQENDNLKAYPKSEGGAFERKATVFRNFITKDGSSGYPAVANRYHLYVNLACPWASRCVFTRKLKGLEDVIGLTVTKAAFVPTRPGVDGHTGWAFPETEDEEPQAGPDPYNGAKFIRDLYEKANPELASTGRYSVPVLWDLEKGTIVNNESAEIMRMFNSEFNELAKYPDLDLYPEALRPQIDELNEWIYDGFNNGVYKSGFAQTQAAYDKAVKEVFETMDKVEDILSKSRYLTGDQFTEADVRLFLTCIRFDEVYHGHFKCNKKLLREYPNLFNFTKEVYQMAPDTVNFFHIKTHYYASHPTINPLGIVSVGSTSWVDYSSPHDRERKY
eukprot:jgi/Mesen1/2509/ME000016S01867